MLKTRSWFSEAVIGDHKNVGVGHVALIWVGSRAGPPCGCSFNSGKNKDIACTAEYRQSRLVQQPKRFVVGLCVWSYIANSESLISEN